MYAPGSGNLHEFYVGSVQCVNALIKYNDIEWKATSLHIHCDPAAIYACEMWKRTVVIAQRLEDVLHRRCLCTILCISWPDHATNEELMRMAGMERLQYIVATRRRTMAGHIIRRQRERLAHGARRRHNKVGKAEEDMAK